MFSDFQPDPQPVTTDEHLADVERARQIANASIQVQKYVEAIVKVYAAEHPDDPILHGYHAAKSNLDALTEAGVIRGHMRLVRAITEEPS